MLFAALYAANSRRPSSGSTSMPHSGRSLPSNRTGLPPDTSCASESLSECAGSVDTISVVWPAAARRTAKEADRLVLPTPPLPETMMYLRPAPAASSANADSAAAVVVVAASAEAAASTRGAGRRRAGPGRTAATGAALRRGRAAVAVARRWTSCFRRCCCRRVEGRHGIGVRSACASFAAHDEAAQRAQRHLLAPRTHARRCASCCPCSMPRQAHASPTASPGMLQAASYALLQSAALPRPQQGAWTASC